jgi:hypothetical protein
VLYAAFPVSKTMSRSGYDTCFHPITSFTGRAILCVHVRSLAHWCAPTADEAKELRLSGNCERHIVTCMNKNSDKCARYSNTLLVSLNNRIYFREHQPPKVGDSASPPISYRVRTAALSSLNFAVPEPQTQVSRASFSHVNPFPDLETLDHGSTELSLVCAS